MLLTVLKVIAKAVGGVKSWYYFITMFTTRVMLTICGSGLFLQALGYGMMSPIQSVIVADQFHKSQVY